MAWSNYKALIRKAPHKLNTDMIVVAITIVEFIKKAFKHLISGLKLFM